MQRGKNRILNLLIGQETLSTISKINVLLVGVGGIGCEVAKNLSKTGFKKITLLDFDIIDETNLNRQFYFRKKHVGKNKAIILKEQIQKIDSSLDIVALCDNLYSKTFTDRFYQQFDLIISALDSIKARQHLAAQATRNGKPLIDAGTMGYNGQAYASIRFVTPCHNCQPSRAEIDTAAACLIRSRPQKPIHCATFAKNFYESFFSSKGETMSDKLKPERFLPESFQYSNQSEIRFIAASIFRELFDIGVSDTDTSGNKIESIRKLKLQQALSQSERVKNPASTIDQRELYKQKNTQYIEEQLWSIKVYTERFLDTILKLIKRRYQGTLPSAFEKDDEDCMLLVYCITNLRTYNFINEHSQQNQLKYLTFYQCKDLIGKVMPAIASTNAIAAALEIRQIVNIATKKVNKMKVIHFSNQSEEKLSPCYQSYPLIDCKFCSQKIIYGKIELDMNLVTFRELEEYCLRQFFSFGRELYSGSLILIRNSKKTSTSNKQKQISFFNQLVTDGVLPVSFRAMLKGTPISSHISIIHRQGLEGIRKIGTPEKSVLRLQLLRYYRKKHENNTQMMASDLRFYGGYEL